MAKYKGIVTTNAGLELLAKACSGGSVMFTAVKTGDGAYDGTEDLSGTTALKSEKQSFGVSGITRIGTQVRVRSVLSNEGLTTGYDITEIGLYAKDPDTGSEFLYAIIVAETGYEDYLPPFEDSPSSITFEIHLTLTESENEVKFMAEVVAGTYASAADLQDHISSGGHVAPEELELWNAMTEDVTNIIDGDTQVGNAKTLDGHEADDFLLKSGGTASGSIAVSNGSSAVAFKADRVQSDGTVSSTRMWTGTDKSALFALYDGSTGTEVTRLELREGSVKARVNNTSVEIVHSGNVETLVTPSGIGAAEDEHEHGANAITAGTLGGKVQANATAAATLSAAQVRDIYAGTADAKAGVSSLTTGTIYAVYE